jgi:hypothetical protein
MRNENVEKIVEFLNQTEKNLRELEMSKESVLQAQEDLENAYDIEDDNERIDEQHRLEIEHSDRVDNVDYLEKHISEEFTTDVAKELVPFVKKLLKYTSSIQHRLDSIAYDARELSDENELDDEFYQANEQLNQQKVSVK